MQTHKILMNVAVAVLFIISAENLTQTQAKPVSNTTKVTAQVSKAKCPYTVTPSDNVYFQIESVTLKPNNLPLRPYFDLYQYKNGKEVRYRRTWSHEGKQICKKVEAPSHFELYFDSRQKEYRLDVLSDWGDQTIAKGTKFSIEPLIRWVNEPKNKTKLYSLKISQGNTVNLQFIRSKKTYYYFQIVSYRIEKIDSTYGKYNMPYGKYALEQYKTSIKVKTEDMQVKEMYPFSVSYQSSKNTPTFCAKLSFVPSKLLNKSEIKCLLNGSDREFLLNCEAGKKVSISIQNKMGELERIVLSTNSVLEQITKCMTNNPTDNSKWVVKFTNNNHSEIVLRFAGIRKLYRVASVTVPMQNSVCQTTRYIEKNRAPKLRVYMQGNGESCGLNKSHASAKQTSWRCDFSTEDFGNIFEIREGIKARYSLQITDALWSPDDRLFIRNHLIDISEITDLDFSKNYVREKFDIDSEYRAATVNFEELKCSSVCE